MMNIRKILIGSIVSAVLVGIVVSCGGGGGYGDSGGGGTVTYTVGGTLAGAAGTVVIQLNGGSNLSMPNGPFTFSGIASGSTYNVTVAAPNQRCTVTGGAGTMGAANIANVTIACGVQANEIVVRSALLTGAQQNPPVVSSASGVGGIIVDPTTRAISGGITFSGLTPTAGGHHIHQAPIGNPAGNGPVIIGFALASDGVTAIVPPNTPPLTQAQYDALLAGELYFNVHTVANPDGEIRGQINMQGGVHANVANLTAGQEVPAGTSTATGTGTLLVDKATRRILISYITHNVANATMAHIHTSPSGAGSIGGVIVGFDTLQTNFDGLGNNLAYPPAASQMTAQNISDFLVSYLYFNVHSTNNLCAPAMNCAAGEIRGNMTPIP